MNKNSICIDINKSSMNSFIRLWPIWHCSPEDIHTYHAIHFWFHYCFFSSAPHLIFSSFTSENHRPSSPFSSQHSHQPAWNIYCTNTIFIVTQPQLNTSSPPAQSIKLLTLINLPFIYFLPKICSWILGVWTPLVPQIPWNGSSWPHVTILWGFVSEFRFSLNYF